MSRKGCSPDNAACERFFGRLKTEVFFSRDWLSTTIEKFVAAVDAYICWYNDAKIKTSLGSAAPLSTAGGWGSPLNQSKFLAAPPWVNIGSAPTRCVQTHHRIQAYRKPSCQKIARNP